MSCKEPLTKKIDRDPRYELHIESRKKNVFVTQLGEGRDDNEEEVVNHIPVVQEAASKILERSKSTHQKTLVLKKEGEADRLNDQLSAKRQEFQQRMDAIAKRRADLQLKQQLNKESTLKFEKFLKDTDAKKQRAIHKYQVEVKQNELKQRELLDLFQHCEELKARQQKLCNKVAKNKIFENFLQKTVDILPENYIEYGADSSMLALIRRYETLSATNGTLVNNQVTLTSELEMAQRQLEALQQEDETIKLMTNSELSQLQMEHDKLVEKNKELDLQINVHRGYFRHQSEELGCLIMAVTNLADDCYMRHYGQLHDMDILTKLDMIKSGCCLISERCGISVLADIHTEDEIYQQKVQDLSKRYSAIRKVEGDGNCFYRALCFAYFESIIGHEKEIEKFKDIALRSKNELLSAGFEETSFWSSFSNFLNAVSLVETENCAASLINVFNDFNQSNSIVQYLRLLTSAFLKNQAEFFQHFLENGVNIKDFCAQEVEPMATVCDHIQIVALCEALEIPVQVEYMDASDNVNHHHTFPEGATPIVYLLYKSSHYDILYASDVAG